MSSNQLIKKQSFRDLPFETRTSKLDRLLQTSPSKVPIIFEKHAKAKMSTEKPDIKFISDRNIKLGFFIEQVRAILTLNEEDALYFSCGNSSVLSPDVVIGELYEKHKEEDGYLYIQFSEISSFG